MSAPGLPGAGDCKGICPAAHGRADRPKHNNGCMMRPEKCFKPSSPIRSPNATDNLARLPRPVHSESSTTCRRARERTEAFAFPVTSPQCRCPPKGAAHEPKPPINSTLVQAANDHHRRRAHHSHYSYCPSPNRKRPGTPPGRFAFLTRTLQSCCAPACSRRPPYGSGMESISGDATKIMKMSGSLG